MLDAQPQGDAREPLPATAGAGRALVLAITHDAGLTRWLDATLRAHYRFASAAGAGAGMACTLELQPDLIVCDAALPDMAGERLLADLQLQPGLLDLPVVLLVEKDETERRLRLLRSGVQDCLCKPVDAQELLARVAGLVQSRRRAQDERERYEQIVATSGDMLAFIDRRHSFVVVNPAYAEMYGHTAAALRQRPVEEILGAYNYAGIRNNIDRALAGKALRLVAEPKLPDGRRRVLDIEYRPFRREGVVQGVVVSLRDITDLKRSEEAFKESEQRLQLALDASGAGLWDLDLQSGRAYLSPQFYALTGHGPQDATQEFDFLQRMVHPDDLQPLLHTMQANLRGQTATSQYDYRIVSPSGQIKWMRGKGRVVERDAEGKPLRMIGTMIDIGVRKAEEEALRRQAEELAQRNDELERFNRATVGRELDMIEIKKQINALSREFGRAAPFPLAFLETPEHGTPVAEP